MSPHLCESRWCLPPTGQHRTDVDPVDHDPACRGCIPALADHGLRLCAHCTHRIGIDALKAAQLYRALGQSFLGGARTTDTTGNVHRYPGLDLSPAVIETRDDIRLTLAIIAGRIAGERGISLPVTRHWLIDDRPHPSFIGPMPARRVARPDRTAHGVAGFIAQHRTWLAAHHRAGEWAADLRDLATNDRAWRYAYPAGGRGRQLLGLCPLPVDGQPCGGRILATPTDAAVTCPRCQAVGTIEEWWHAINPGQHLGHLVDAYYAAQRLSATYGRDIDPGTVRKWGQRTRTTGVAPARRVSLTKGVPGELIRDERQRVLYPWHQLDAHAAKLYRVSLIKTRPRRSPRTSRKDDAA